MPPAKKSQASSAPAAPVAQGDARIFLVYGSDDLSATRQAEELVARLCPSEEQAFGLETFSPEPDQDSADTVCTVLRNVMEALLTAPFLGGNKTVFLRQAPYFDPLSEPGRFASVKAEVERLVNLLKKGLPAGVSFVLLTRKVNKATTFYKTFQSLGAVYAFDEPGKDSEVKAEYIPQLKKWVAERQLIMPENVLGAFVDRVGYSLRQAASELDKLDLYLGERRTVTREDIERMIAPMRASKFWEFAEAFCSGQLDKTLQTMHRLLAQGEEPIALLITLQNRLREIVVMADCLKRGWVQVSGGDWPRLTWSVPPAGEALLAPLGKRDPRKGNPYALGKMAAQAKRLPPSRWFRWLHAAVDAQAAMTGGDNVPPATTLEVFTTRTLGELTAPK